jgi:hypothetical protein
MRSQYTVKFNLQSNAVWIFKTPKSKNEDCLVMLQGLELASNSVKVFRDDMKLYRQREAKLKLDVVGGGLCHP